MRCTTCFYAVKVIFSLMHWYTFSLKRSFTFKVLRLMYKLPEQPEKLIWWASSSNVLPKNCLGLAVLK